MRCFLKMPVGFSQNRSDVTTLCVLADFLQFHYAGRFHHIRGAAAIVYIRKEIGHSQHWRLHESNGALDAVAQFAATGPVAFPIRGKRAKLAIEPTKAIANKIARFVSVGMENSLIAIRMAGSVRKT